MARKLVNTNIPIEPPPSPPSPPPPPTPPVLTATTTPAPSAAGKVLTKEFLVKAPGAVSIRVLNTTVFLNDGRKSYRLPRPSATPVSITVTLS